MCNPWWKPNYLVLIADKAAQKTPSNVQTSPHAMWVMIVSHSSFSVKMFHKDTVHTVQPTACSAFPNLVSERVIWAWPSRERERERGEGIPPSDRGKYKAFICLSPDISSKYKLVITAVGENHSLFAAIIALMIEKPSMTTEDSVQLWCPSAM